MPCCSPSRSGTCSRSPAEARRPGRPRFAAKGRRSTRSCGRADEPSVIAAAAELVARLGRLDDELPASAHPVCGPASVFIGQIHSGEIYNQYPQSAWLEGTRRWLPGTDPASRRVRFRQRLDRLAADTRTTIDVRWMLIRDAFSLDPADPLVSSFQRCYEAISGAPLPLGPKPFVDDGNSFSALGAYRRSLTARARAGSIPSTSGSRSTTWSASPCCTRRPPSNSAPLTVFRNQLIVNSTVQGIDDAHDDQMPGLISEDQTTEEEFLRQIFVRDQMAEWSKQPLVMARADGVFYWDVEGKRYLDALSGIYVASVGHNNRRVIEAIKHQLDVLTSRRRCTARTRWPCNWPTCWPSWRPETCRRSSSSAAERRSSRRRSSWRGSITG